MNDAEHAESDDDTIEVELPDVPTTTEAETEDSTGTEGTPAKDDRREAESASPARDGDSEDQPPADSIKGQKKNIKKDSAPEKDGAPDEKDTEKKTDGPHFILYLEGERYAEALDKLTLWVHYLLVPVYARETSSSLPWCPRWWEHQEAIAQLYGLWMAWQHHTGAKSELTGPGIWHRDFLGPTMQSLRDPAGPFAGCKQGGHRPKRAPFLEQR
ncbi:DUF4913 domain-containing protein [Streptomyces sp. NPDC017943]|uniref:DUF4913 domain-containing protein n=1 Tax=Streptomyces sp. NPDC017943 TaxID=3365019 RepID=UPI00378F0C11